MKMAAIATAVTTVLVSSSVLAAEVYNSDGTSLSIGGRAEFRGDFVGQESGATLDGTMDNKSRFRLNVGGETQINDSLSAVAFYEGEQSVKNSNTKDNNDTFTQRYMYAGLGSNDNVVTFGKQDAATVQISQMSDNVSTYSGIQKTYINAGDEQINNAINYSGYFMDALSLKASYLASNEANQDGYALSGIYTIPFGLGIGLGYAANDNDGDQQDSKQFLGGLSYQWESLYVAATYTQGQGSKKYNLGDNDFHGTEFVARYMFDNGFQAIVGYQKGTIDPDAGDKFDVSNYVELTGQYYFNKNIISYLSYKFNNLDQGDMCEGCGSSPSNVNASYFTDDADNSLRLGLLYLF
ncbi:porin [Vibrio mediterranei]|uniref:porin n=1 Tax=Vibrio mediterranei TaxID=689 RepID=UPI00148C8297|nr:porin [Vibrio mediterranei]NOH30248.1 porin [Vibrio mediterranei]